MNKVLSEQSDWDELLELISEQNLTPIIGKEVYKFKDNDTLTPFDDYLSQQLLLLNKVTDQPPMSLTSAVSLLLNEKKQKPTDVTRKLKPLVKEVGFDFPLLKQLLAITEFSYFVNTSVYNSVVEQKFKEVRGEEISSINFSINEPFADCDDLSKLKQPFVFNVFGSLLNTVDAALSEEDMLEFTGSFKDRLISAPNLVNALRNQTLLFIGCAFPDWMVRFFMRILSNEPLHNWGDRRKIIVVNDNTTERKLQFDYLQRFDVVTYEGNTADFVSELSAQWKKKNPTAAKSKRIFLSYTMEDREAVESLKAALESIENVTCWYDNRELTPGDDFITMISTSIRSADLFIPLLSARSLGHKEGYVYIEWFTANNVNAFRKQDGNTSKFLMPIVIDDTNAYDPSVPVYFSNIIVGKVPSGKPDEKFILDVKQALQLA